MANKTRKRPAADLRVNVPLGKHFRTLSELACQQERTKTALARLLIVDGIKRLTSGEWVIKEGLDAK